MSHINCYCKKIMYYINYYKAVNFNSKMLTICHLTFFRVKSRLGLPFVVLIFVKQGSLKKKKFVCFCLFNSHHTRGCQPLWSFQLSELSNWECEWPECISAGSGAGSGSSPGFHDNAVHWPVAESDVTVRCGSVQRCGREFLCGCSILQESGKRGRMPSGPGVVGEEQQWVLLPVCHIV